MSTDIHSLVRYHIIDQVLSEKKQAGINELLQALKAINPEEKLTEEILIQDIESMRSDKRLVYNAPIVFNEENRVYSYTDKSYSIQKIPLNNIENQTLLVIASYLDLTKNHKDLSGLKGAIQKLVDLMQIRNAGLKPGAPDFVESEITPAFGGSKYISPIITAIKNKRVVRLYYLPFYEDKPYFTNVHPYLLKEYKGRWYLIGLNDTKKEIRTYGLDRIWEMEVIEQAFIQKTFTATDYFKNSVGVISPIGEPPEIHVEVSSHQAKYLITQPLHNSQYIEKEEKDFVVFSYRVHPTYEFKSMILAMGKDARVLKPENFKKEVMHELNDAILGYGRSQ